MSQKSFDRLIENIAHQFADRIETNQAPWDYAGPPAAYPIEPIFSKPILGITALQMICKQGSRNFSDPRWLSSSMLASVGGEVRPAEGELVSPGWSEHSHTVLPEKYFNVEQCEKFKRLPPLLDTRMDYSAFLRDLTLFCDYRVIEATSESEQPAQVTDHDLRFPHNEKFYENFAYLHPGYSAEQLHALDGIRAIAEHELSDYSNRDAGSQDRTVFPSVELEKRLGLCFLESRLGARLPFVKPLTMEERKDLSRLIRSNPADLLIAANSASLKVERIFTLSKSRFILVDFEKDDVIQCSSDDVRKYVQKTLNEIEKNDPTVTHAWQFRRLRESVNSRGFFDPIEECRPFDALSGMTKTVLGHHGLMFIFDRPDSVDEFNSPSSEAESAFEALALCDSKNALIKAKLEKAILESRIGPEHLSPEERSSWFEQQKNKFRPLNTTSVLVQWNELEQRKRPESQEPLDACWLVDFENHTIEKTHVEQAIDRSVDLLKKLDRIIPDYPDMDHGFLSQVYDLIEKHESSSAYGQAQTLDEQKKNLNVCFEALSPSCNHNAQGNFILKTLDHKGLIIVTKPQDLLKLSHWTDLDVQFCLAADGFNLQALKKSLDERPMSEVSQDFNDLFHTVRTWTSIERNRREKQEEAALQKLFNQAGTERLNEIQEEVKKRFSFSQYQEIKPARKINSHNGPER